METFLSFCRINRGSTPGETNASYNISLTDLCTYALLCVSFYGFYNFFQKKSTLESGFLTSFYVYDRTKLSGGQLTEEEIKSLRKLLFYSISEEEVELLRELLLCKTFKEIHNIELLIKQVPKLSETVGELLVDVKKMEEDIENVQEKIHSHTAPDIRKNIFNEYKFILKNHNDRLLSLQHKVENYIARGGEDMVSTDWFMLPLGENYLNTHGSHQTGAASVPDYAPHTPTVDIPSVNSDILINEQIFNDTDSVDKK